ncbi:MAG: WbuC family cupin fold metalloprotein [Balneolales bacterium]|nr:WbuC family cupin fold metalloprotein [Balneolales bacterium]
MAEESGRSSGAKKLALDNFSGDVFCLDEALLARGCRAATESPRLRIIYPVQRTQGDLVQRLLNFMQPGTYVMPHMHPMPHATESIILHRGAIQFYIFEEDGSLARSFRLEAGRANCMVDISARVWHSFEVLEKDTVLIEFKKGPYDAATDKVFAGWAPQEDSGETEAFLENLRAQATRL